MAFVKVRNLYGQEARIPSSAVEAYRGLGFIPVYEKDSVTKDNKEEKVPAKSDDKVNSKEITEPEKEDGDANSDEKFVETLQKKPLASWNKDEVKKYAAIYNIDLSGTKSANDAKERIKAFMSDAE